MKKPNSPHSKTKQHKWYINKSYRDIHGLFIEAICPHGIGHHKGIHGCDGCCTTAPKDIWNQVTSDENSPHSKKKCKFCSGKGWTLDRWAICSKCGGSGNTPPQKQEISFYKKSPKEKLRGATTKNLVIEQESGGWEERYRNLFNDFITSALWYEPVKQFISTELQEAKRKGYERGIDAIKKVSGKLPIEIVRKGDFYYQGMHAGLDLAIDKLHKLFKKV